MESAAAAGWIVILNGVPRSGKTSIAKAMQETLEGVWMNIGVDAYARMTPERYLPGMGLRPGGERPDLEELVLSLYVAMYKSVAAHGSQGLNVVVDVGIHDAYSQSLRLWALCSEALGSLPVLLVGVRCPLEVIMQRRNASEGSYLNGSPSDPPPQVLLWEQAVHTPGTYDLEVDTSQLTPEECAARIGQRLRVDREPTAMMEAAEWIRQRRLSRQNPEGDRNGGRR